MTHAAPALLTGIHHVTALAKDPRRNLDFYTRVLGARLVKKTVNFDDPLTYHLYYGDHAGHPGTLLTHFPHPHAARGTHGIGEIRRTLLTVPPGSLTDWTTRLQAAGVAHSLESLAGEDRLLFEDPDGMLFGLIESSPPPGSTGFSPTAGAPQQHAIGGIYSVEIHVPDPVVTAAFLVEALGFARAPLPTDAASGRQRLTLGDGGPGRVVDLVRDTGGPRMRLGAGIVHHVAWRVPNDQAQAAVGEALRGRRIASTPVMDRQYFRSIYFRIPGDVVFEVATDGPGFDADEPLESLGTHLRLPPQHEPRRAEIERQLVPLH